MNDSVLIGIEFEYHTNLYQNIYFSKQTMEDVLGRHIAINDGRYEYTESREFLDALLYFDNLVNINSNRFRHKFEIAHVFYLKGRFDSYGVAVRHICKEMYTHVFYNENGGKHHPINVDFMIKQMRFPYKLNRYRQDNSSLLSWEIHQDISDRDLIEITSPLLNMSEVRGVLETVFDYIRRCGTTSNNCGLHVHVSTPGLYYNNIQMEDLMLHIDEAFVFSGFDDRRKSGYCDSTVETFKNRLVSYRYADMTSHPIVTDSQKSELRAIMKRLVRRRFDKQCGVNPQNVTGDISENNHIEFRYLGGEQYERKLESILARIEYFVDVVDLFTNDKHPKRSQVFSKLNDTFDSFVDELNTHYQTWIDAHEEGS